MPGSRTPSWSPPAPPAPAPARGRPRRRPPGRRRRPLLAAGGACLLLAGAAPAVHAAPEEGVGPGRPVTVAAESRGAAAPPDAGLPAPRGGAGTASTAPAVPPTVPPDVPPTRHPDVPPTGHPDVPPDVAVSRGWGWPVLGEPRVLRPFEAPVQRWSPGHRGVDLAAGPGAVVLAPSAGVVALAGRVVDRGVVVLEHEGGLRTTLEPVVPLLAAGAAVRRGEPVARLASGGHCPAGCLHWGVRRGRGAQSVYLDPLALLGAPAPPVLLPLAPPG